MFTKHLAYSIALLSILIAISICIHIVIVPIGLYLGALYEPDLYGYPDCDTMNDWFTHVLPVLQPYIYKVGTTMCIPFQYN